MYFTRRNLLLQGYNTCRKYHTYTIYLYKENLHRRIILSFVHVDFSYQLR